jgi:hypothetical protein
MLNNKDFHMLEQFILSQCQESQHFALQAYLLVRSMGETGSEKWKKRCRKILKTVFFQSFILPSFHFFR